MIISMFCKAKQNKRKKQTTKKATHISCCSVVNEQRGKEKCREGRSDTTEDS